MSSSIIVFFAYFCLVLAISIVSYRASSDADDFVTGGRNFSPGTVALSAGAADNSGWLLLAVPGLAYANISQALWLMSFLLLGSYLSWTYLAPYLRSYVKRAPQVLTLPDLLEHKFSKEKTPVRSVAALIMILFSTVYAAANITAGAVLFNEIFAVSYSEGALLVFAFVLVVTAIGGFTAICWMDIFQALLMLSALIIVPVIVIYNLDSETAASAASSKLYLEFNSSNGLGGSSWLTGLFYSVVTGAGWALGYFGQPHILSRYMVIKNVSGLGKAKRLALSWYFCCLAGAVSVGFFGSLYFTEKLAEPELVFLELAATLFPPVIAGVLYASVWAAIMSTINAQLMVAGNILAHDVCFPIARKFKFDKENFELWQGLFSRAMVVLVLIVAVFLAVNFRQTIMSFVAYAWAGFGASFSPIMISSCLGWRYNGKAAIACMLSGTSTVIIWRSLGYHVYVYELVAGFIVAFLVLKCFSKSK